MTSRQSKSRASGLFTVIVAWGAAAGLSLASMMAFGQSPGHEARDAAATPATTPPAHAALDRSGKPRTGKASFYASRYSGRTMSDGKPMRLYSNNAASLTLPLGTTALVTNLENGRTAIVTIEDRGPYVAGRIIDLSPATARHIGLSKRQGLAQVEVAPLSVPMVDGTVKVIAHETAVAANLPRGNGRTLTSQD